MPEASRRAILLGLLTSAAAARQAAAQDYPAKPLRIVAPFGPGTATDIVARIGAGIASHTGRMVIDNAGVEGQISARRSHDRADSYDLHHHADTRR